MTGYNLPPGCSDFDLPGESPEDVAWIQCLENVSPADCAGCERSGGCGSAEVPEDCLVAEARYNDWMNGER